MGYKKIHNAKTNVNDEFYTQLVDIERELGHYKEQLKGKTIYMNADNPKYSMFWRYFRDNFHKLNLNKIIATYYKEDTTTYKHEYDGISIDVTPLEGNGDFRSDESVQVLEESDIVITNPPFSLYREYMAQLVKHDKDFLIVGNYLSAVYKDVFPLVKNRVVKFGYSGMLGDFILPCGELKSVNAHWFTTLEVKIENNKIELTKEYNEIDYPKYDNYNAIEVGRVANIPKDYYGVMGVPITYLHRHNSEQFELLGIGQNWCNSLPEGIHDESYSDKPAMIDGKLKFTRLFIRRVQ